MSGVRGRGVRYRPDTGFEMRCEGCAAKRVACWWPLTTEFWNQWSGLTRCRACVNEHRRSIRPVTATSEGLRAYKREWMRQARARQRMKEVAA
jgi:hypothetical protein